MSQILVRPIVTEKMARLGEESKQYAFEVLKSANKIDIRKAIESRYPDVKVNEVRTMNVRGKNRRRFTKRGVVQGKQRSYKKAIVSLKEGEIDFFENI